MVARLALVAAIAAAPACYAPAFTDCELACSPGGDCPAGFVCSGQVCRPVGAAMPCPRPMPDAPIDAGMVSVTPHPMTMWMNASQVVSPGPGMVYADPSLTGDELQLFVSVSYGSNVSDLLVATRLTTGETFAPFANAMGLNDMDTLINEVAPDVSSDGLTMHFTSNRSGSQGDHDIWTATRVNRTATWEPPIPVANLSSTELDTGGSITANGRMAALASMRGGAAGNQEIYIATRSTSMTVWESPLRQPELNSTVVDSHPHLSPDGLTIYFHSNRVDPTDYDLYEAHRSSATMPFGNPRRLVELSTPGYEEAPWVSPDGKHIYFTRTVGGVKHIFDATR